MQFPALAGIVPGIVFVDGTLAAAPEAVDTAIAQAKRFIANLPA